MFSELKKAMKQHFEKMLKMENRLFYITIDREQIWNVYLESFDASIRQEYNCNCCKSFLRQWGGICTIKDNLIVSIWDFDTNLVDDKYKNSISKLARYVKSLPVLDIFLNPFSSLGTDKNVSSKEILWEHFHLDIPKQYVLKEPDATLAQKRDTKAVLKRGLDELTLDSLDTVIELIGQNSLYRGKEFEKSVTDFRAAKLSYSRVPNDLKDNYAWVASLSLSEAIARIRNTSIGTLLIDLSAGMDLDEAVAAFERVVAPTNYKRPTALVTPRMVDEAKKKIEELGFIESLDRRYAAPTDIKVDHVLYVDRSSDLKDIFDEMKSDAPVNPRTFSKVEEVTIADFIEKILPTSKSVEVLLENTHMSNMFTLLTGVHKEAPSMFKWKNPFSWSYTGGISDSMKERVKTLGGKVDGVLRFSIQWNEDGKSIIDLDAHAHEPGGAHIYYGSGYRGPNSFTPMSGNLDIDMINPREVGIENITWANRSKMKDGIYRLRVYNFSAHRNFDGVRCEVEFDGEIHEFSYNKPFTQFIEIAEVTLKDDKFSITPKIESKSNVSSREKWGVKTNTFTKVKNIMLSPNYWEKPVGNKHFFFVLDNCVSDEKPRPFLNEFLTEDLSKERKVFEILGSKVAIPDSTNQISGVGFSETQRNHLIVRVRGKFKRELKINF